MRRARWGGDRGPLPVRGAGDLGDLVPAVGGELAALRRRLRFQVVEDGQPVPAGLDRSPAEADQACAEVAREIDLRAREALLRRLRALEGAAARIAAGTYGLCLACGERIPTPRLKAIPEAVLCLPCQSAREGARRA